MKKSIIVWNDATDGPDSMSCDKPILCMTENGKLIVFKETRSPDHWRFLADKYRISYWTYQDEIEILDL